MPALPASALASSELPLSPGDFPAAIDLEPGAVGATVSLASITGPSGDVACWCYATTGLAARGQRELLIALRVPDGRDGSRPPTAPLSFFATVAKLAAQNQLVDAGDLSELGGAGMLGGRGFVYADAPPLPGSGAAPGSLIALRVTAEEIAVARAYGVSRLLASWGAAYRHYPFLPWCEESRASVVTLESFRGSILEKVPRMPVRGWARMERGMVRLELLADDRPRFAALAQLPADAGFALLTRIDPAADGCLVWRSGQREPAGITPPGSQGQRVSGCCVMFVPSQNDDRGRIFEDGFAMMLRDASAAAVRGALARGEALELPGAGGELGLSLAWVPTEYRNPFDGSVVRASGGMRTYEPSVPVANSGPVRATNVALLTPEGILAERVKTDDLAAFVREICAVAEATLGRGRGAAWEAMVDVKLAPGTAPALRWMTRGDGVDGVAMHELEARAAAILGPGVRGDVALQVFFVIDAR